MMKTLTRPIARLLFFPGLLGLLLVLGSLSPLQAHRHCPSAHRTPVDATAPVDLKLAVDPGITAMIAGVQATAVQGYVGELSGQTATLVGGSAYTFLTRCSLAATPIQKATQYAYEHFEDLGLPVQYQSYAIPGEGACRNVIAEQRGQTQPDRIYLVVAHLDDTNEANDNLAPGADDNASGSAGVLVAADILSRYRFGCTLRYVLVTGEEQGLYGSNAYAASLAASGANIAGVLNLDMIGYNSNSAPVMELHTRPNNAGDLAVANMFANVISAYQLALTPQIVQDSDDESDQYSFWANGIPAVLAIEDFEDLTPYYHDAGDILSSLNLTYMTNFIKAAVGTMAHLAGPVSGVTLTASPASPRPVNTRVTLSAAAGLGTNTQYMFRAGYTNGTIWTWTTIRAYNTASTCAWTPTQARTYTLTVIARNPATGQTASKAISYRICPLLSAVALAASPASPQPVNTRVTLTATPTGGANVQYLFRVGYSDTAGWHWSILRSYASSRTCTWTPAARRTYTLVVWAREAGSTAAYQVGKSIGYVVR